MTVKQSMLERWHRRLVGTRSIAFMDQAVVSGTSFLTSVMIARFAGAGELGLYAIAISVLFVLIAVQESLVLLPYTIQKHQPVGTPREHAGASFALSGMLAATGVGFVTIAAVALAAVGEPAHAVAMACALAALVPFAMAREFARQFGFAHLKVAQVLAFDVVVAALQLGALGALGIAGQLSGLTAALALCAAYGVVLSVWLLFARADFALRKQSLRANLARSWSLGKWLLTGRVTVQVQCYITYWISVVLGGASMTGVFAACMSIIAFSNPIVFGLGNVLTPRSVLAWKSGGGAALLAQALRDSALLAGLMGAFCLVIFVAGGELMALLYRGGDFAGHAGLLTVLALANAFLAVGMPATNALAAMERPRAVVAVQAIGAIVTVGLVSVLIVKWGLYGAAYGALAGSLIGTIARWAALVAVARRQSSAPPILAVLQQQFPQVEAKTWQIERLGEGDFATAYLVTPCGVSLVPDPAGPMVVKLYKSARAGMAQADADALDKLGKAMDGHRIASWTVTVPRPLLVCGTPPALVMTVAPGKDLHACSAASSQSLTEAAQALAAAMHEAWARGVAHGDFGLRNILIDLERKHIGLIDPGTPESCDACGALVGAHGAAARDLAHMICEHTTDITDLIGGQDVRVQRDSFVTALLSTALEHGGPDLIADIKTCVDLHLAGTLRPSWSARGLWHRFIMRLARDRSTALFAGLADQHSQGLNLPGRTAVRAEQLLDARAAGGNREHLVHPHSG